MAQISVPKSEVGRTLARITEEGGTLLRSKLSENKMEVVLIYEPGFAKTPSEQAALKLEKERDSLIIEQTPLSEQSGVSDAPPVSGIGATETTAKKLNLTKKQP